MVGTKAKWFRPPGSKPVYEPQRPGRRYPAPVKGDDYRLPGSYPGDRRRPIPEPLPSREPRVPNDPRFLPGREYGPPAERPARPSSPLKPPRGRFRLPRGGWAYLPDVLDYGEGLFFPNYSQPPRLPSNYVWCLGPLAFPPIVTRPPPYGFWTSPGFFRDPGSCTIGLPLDGQVSAWSVTLLQTPYSYFNTSPARIYWRRQYQHSGAFKRDYIAGTVSRVGPALNPQPKPVPFSTVPATWKDPNIERWLPTYPDPFADVPIPEFQIGVGTPLLEGPEGFDNPDLPYQPDHAWQFQVGIGLTDYVKPPTDTPVVVQPTPPAGRKPPARNERQGKLLSRAAKLGIALYKILDGVSEGAEIVDAFYDALPADVRKRWEKERFPDAYWIKDKNTGKWERVGVERPGDNFGQYGIDGADWKLQALYYNWHRVDYEKAVVNVFKNELSDKVIGDIQKRLPRNAGAAHSQGELEFAATLDEWLDVALEYF